MPNSRLKPSLRQLLTVKLLGLTLLSTLVIALLGAWFLAAQLRSNAEEHLRESALRVHDGTESFLVMHQTCIRSLAARLTPPSDQPIRVDLARDILENTLPHYSGILTMLVTNHEGRIIRAIRRNEASFTPSGNERQWVADRPYFLQPRLTLKPYTSGVFQGRGLGQDPIVAISAPILDARRQFAGVVEASLDITRIPLNPEDMHLRLVSLVYDGEGKIVYSADPASHRPLTIWSGHRSAGNAPDLKLFQLREEIDSKTGASALDRYAVRYPLTSAGWQVVSLVAAEDLDGEVHKFYAMVAVALSLLFLLAYQLARHVARTLSLPVVSLVGDMQRFNVEQAEITPPVYDLIAREFAQIYNEFRGMALRLQHSFAELRKALSERDETNRALNELLANLDRKVAERTEQLAASEARYRQVIDTSGDIIYRTSLKGRIEFHNPAFERFLGSSAIGLRMAGFLTAESRSQALAHIREQIASRTPIVYLELHVKRGDGDLRWLGQSTQVIRNDAGEVIGFQAIAHDITDRKLAEIALREAEERYALAVRGSNNGIWDWDVRNQTMYFSARWREMFGLAADLLFDTLDAWVLRVHPSDRQAFLVAITCFAVEESGQLFEHEHRIRHEDGTWRWALTCGAAVRDHTGQALRIAGSTTDITSGKLQDPLTGLPNRLAIVERIDQWLARQKEDPGRKFALLFMDLDRFKMINDSMGHIVGDELLFSVSRRLLSAAHQVAASRATVGRLGGDEFVIVVEVDDQAGLPTRIAEAVLAEMVAPHHLQGSLVFAGTSIGIASAEGIHHSEDLLRNADTAMYQAKTEGRGRYCVFDTSMHARAVARLELETDLRRAVEAGEFLLHYQPQVDLRSGHLSGFEALVRWHHPRRGMIPPVEFISVAEENGLILPIGRWVIEEGIRQLAEWDARFPAARRLSLSLNLSPRQFIDPALKGNVETALSASGINPDRIHLEITESMVADDPAHAQTILRELSALGVGLEIDDFGTGYSCLSQLHQLPFDTLKVDRSFVQALDISDSGQQDGGKIVESIVKLSSSLGIHVVAEGIESERHWVQLARLGCELGQGYYFSRPIPAPQVPDLIAHRTTTPWDVPAAVLSLSAALMTLHEQVQSSADTSPLPHAADREPA